MIVKQPTIEELRRIAHGFNLDMTDEDLKSFQGLMGGVLAWPCTCALRLIEKDLSHTVFVS